MLSFADLLYEGVDTSNGDDALTPRHLLVANVGVLCQVSDGAAATHVPSKLSGTVIALPC